MKCSECRASKEMRGVVCLAAIIPYHLKKGGKGCGCNSKQIEKYIRDFNPEKTHFDEIKSMSVEELAVFMHDMFLISTEIGLSTDWWLLWLKSPVEVDNGT